MKKKPNLKIIKPKKYDFIDQLIDAVQYHFSEQRKKKQRRKLTKEYYENVEDIKAELEQL